MYVFVHYEGICSDGFKYYPSNVDSMVTHTTHAITITVRGFGSNIRYTLPRGALDLIGLIADTQLSYMYNELDDGERDDMPSRDQFIADIYRWIINSRSMPVSIGGTEIEVDITDNIRFLGSDVIQTEIANVWDGSFNAMDIEDSAVRVR